jgi:hypothetical protein
MQKRTEGQNDGRRNSHRVRLRDLRLWYETRPWSYNIDRQGTRTECGISHGRWQQLGNTKLPNDALYRKGRKVVRTVFTPDRRRNIVPSCLAVDEHWGCFPVAFFELDAKEKAESIRQGPWTKRMPCTLYFMPCGLVGLYDLACIDL